MLASRNILVSLGVHAVCAVGLIGVVRVSALPSTGNTANIGEPLFIQVGNLSQSVAPTKPLVEKTSSAPATERPTLRMNRAQHRRAQHLPSPTTQRVTKKVSSGPSRKQALLPRTKTLTVESARRQTLFDSLLSTENSARSAGKLAGSRASDLALYRTRVIEIIQRNHSYPEQAFELEQQGMVQVRCKISSDGSVMETRIERASRYPSLNQGALELLRRVGKFPPLPKSLANEPLSIVLPIQYLLEASS